MPNLYSYLWPYSGTFSAVNALFATTGDKEYKSVLDNKVLVGLEEYFDNRRTPRSLCFIYQQCTAIRSFLR